MKLNAPGEKPRRARPKSPPDSQKGPDTKGVSAKFVIAKTFFDERNFAAAASAAAECLELDPQHAQAARLRGKALVALKSMPEAVAAFTLYCDLMPRDPAGHHDLAKALFQNKEGAKSVASFQAALALQPERHDARIGLARALVKFGKPDEAIDAFRRYIFAKPDDIPAQLELLNAYVTARRFDDAVNFSEAFLGRHPDNAQAHRHLAKALRGLGQHDRAAFHFSAYCEAHPYDAASQHDLGRALLASHNYKAAAQVLAHTLVLAPDRHSVHLDLGRTFLALGQPHVAEAQFLALIQATPRDVNGHLELARLRERNDQHERAAVELATAAAAYPDPRLYRELARLHRQQGKIDAALAALTEAFRLNDSDFALLLDFARLQLLARNHEAALPLFLKVSAQDPKRAGIRRNIATCLMALGKLEDAEPWLREEIAENPGNSGAMIDLGRLLNRLKRFEDAIRVFSDLLVLDSTDVRAHHGIGVAYRRSGSTARALECFAHVLALDPNHITTLLQLAELAHLSSALDDVITYTDRILDLQPEHLSALMLRAQVAFERGQTVKALADIDRILALNGSHPKALLFRDLVRRDIADNEGETAIDLCLLTPVTVANRKALKALAELSIKTPNLDDARPSWIQQILTSTADWILMAPDRVPNKNEVTALRRRLGLMVGAVVEDLTAPATGPSLWAREPLATWLRMTSPSSWADCAAALAPRLRLRALAESFSLTPSPTHTPTARPQAWLVSSSGMNLFGGVERFLRSMVPIYREMGYEPVIVGLLEMLDSTALEGEIDGLRFLNVERSVDAVRAAGLRHSPAIVQCTTGIGYEVTHGLEGQTPRIIYGSHFWRDMFVGVDSFENIDRNGRPRAEFKRLCATIDQGYANSTYTQEVIRRHFEIIQPIVYSLPFDRDPNRARPPGRYVLLMNGRPDKGFTLLLEIARRLPEIPFVAVASQVSKDRITEMVRQAGLTNIEIIGWVEDTAALYQEARAVLVASYAFIETFSRVTIEAHRFGVPVIGSDRGNVPLLLKESGVALPEDADLWAQEIDRLFSDAAYYRKRSKLALENSERYRFSDQPKRVAQIIKASKDRLAIAVGSGIGNMIQCSPMIRRVSEHFEKPVDIIIKQDFPGCGSLFAGSEYVGQVFESTALTSKLNYRAVLVLDCFGDLIPRFNSDATFVTRRKFPFNMTKEMHEAEFNLLCAREFLGVPYAEGDAAKYFIGSTVRGPTRKGRIGLHAGGKAGVWLAKRWPHFAELAALLVARGYEVVSFGGADEFVEGTVNLTGTDLATSIAAVGTCDYFIANDSGLMHVADALGVPLAAIFGPTSVLKNGPLAPTSLTIAITKDCAPCQFDTARFASCRCIQELALGDVVARIDSHMASLGLSRPQPSARTKVLSKKPSPIPPRTAGRSKAR